MDSTTNESAEKSRKFVQGFPPILFGSLAATCVALGALQLSHRWPFPAYGAPAVLMVLLITKLINAGKGQILHYATGSLYFIVMLLWVIKIANGFLAVATYFLPLYVLDALADEYLRRNQASEVRTPAGERG